MADFYGLGERAEYRSERTEADGVDNRVDGANWGGLADAADAADYEILDGADGADWSGRGGRGGGGRIGSSLEGRKGRTGKPGVGMPVDWADRLGCARPG